jgi:hypothetical protein
LARRLCRSGHYPGGVDRLFPEAATSRLAVGIAPAYPGSREVEAGDGIVNDLGGGGNGTYGTHRTYVSFDGVAAAAICDVAELSVRYRPECKESVKGEK